MLLTSGPHQVSQTAHQVAKRVVQGDDWARGLAEPLEKHPRRAAILSTSSQVCLVYQNPLMIISLDVAVGKADMVPLRAIGERSSVVRAFIWKVLLQCSSPDVFS